MVTLETRPGRWLTIALTASLAVNIFLGGLFVGRQMMFPPPMFVAAAQRPGDRPMPAYVDRVAEALPPDHRDTFLAMMAKYRPQIAAAGESVRQARMKVRELLTAPKFDHAATEAAMGELRARNTEFQRTMQTALLDAADALPPEARRLMVNTEGRRAAQRE